MRSRTTDKSVELLMERYNHNSQSLVFSKLANEYCNEGDISKAIEICNNGLQVHPEYVTGRIVLGRCYVEQGNPQAAIEQLLTVFSYDRKNQAAMKMLADLYRRQEKLGKAGDLYNLLYRMDPGNKSLELLSKQFQSDEKNDIYKILGLPSPQTSFNFQSKEEWSNPNPSDINKTFVESSQDSFNNEQTKSVTDELDLPYGSEELSSPPVSSDEIGVRMDALFGDLQTEQLNPTPQYPDELVSQNFSEVVENSADKGITGDDITDRMNALFGTVEQKGNTSEITSSSFFDSDVTEISGDDISMHIDMLDQDRGTEALNSGSFQPELLLENDNNQLDMVNLQNDPSDTNVLGSDISDRFDTLIGNIAEENQPDFADPLTMGLPFSMDSGEMSRADLHAQLEKNTPEDSFDSDLSFRPAQNTDAFSNTISVPPEVFHSSEESFSGDDFVSHIEEISGDGFSSYSNPDNKNQRPEDLLSTEVIDLSKFTGSDLSGDDFCSHIDSMINTEEPLQQQESQFIIQDNDLKGDTRSIKKEGDFLFEDNFINNGLSTPSENLVQDQNFSETINLNTDLIAEVNESVASSEDVAFVTSDAQNLSGDDFSLHIDKILGDDTEKSLPFNQNNLLSDPGENTETFGNTENIVSSEVGFSGDDVSDHFDSIFGENLQPGNSSIYDKITQGFDNPSDTASTVQNDQLLSEGDFLSGDDFGGHIDLISGENRENNQPSENMQGIDLIDIANEFSKNELIISEDGVTGEDITDQLDNLSGDDSPVSAESFQSNKFDLLSPFTNSEFEETLQFDRSLIESAQAEYEAGTLNVLDTPEPESVLYDQHVDISTNMDAYLGVENETISIDRSEINLDITDEISDINIADIQSESANNGLSETFTLNIENPSPNTEPLGEIEDVRVDHNSENISEMDVFVSSTTSFNGITGDDVTEKLDSLFPPDTINIDNAPSLQNDSYQGFSLENPVVDSTSEPESFSNSVELGQGYDDPDTKGSSSFISESISGNDVEKRIDVLFNGFSSSSDANDQLLVNVDIDKDRSFQDLKMGEVIEESFGDIVQDIGISISDEEPQIDDLKEEDSTIFVDSVDITDSDIPLEPMQNALNQSVVVPENPPVVNSNSSDDQTTSDNEEREKPFSIPDHVLTPTLADIYFQQGQLQLSVQIYARLLEKDPDNDKLVERLEEIQGKIAQQESGGPVESGNKKRGIEENLKQGTTNTKNVLRKKKATESERPLAGIKIKKGKKSQK